MGLTLREGNREYFYSKLDKYFPHLKARYIREFGNSYVVNSKNNYRLMKIFRDFCESEQIMYDYNKIFSYLNTFEEKEISKQLSIFDL